MKKMDKKPLSLIEFGVAASVGALALIGASTLIGYTKRANQTRIQHDTPEYSDESLEYSDEKIQALIKEGYIPIATAEELNSIRSNAPRLYGVGTKWKAPYTGGLSERYVQVANIDLSEYGDWTPIGAVHANFRGTYDGGNYVITGLEVKGEGKNNQGLFERAEGATISNVGLIDNKVTGSYFVGGLVGYAYRSTTISNSYATGSVEGTDNVGGLVGGANNSMISNSYSTGLVKGSAVLGGLVGGAYYSTISNSYSAGSVVGRTQLGGLVGKAARGGEISNSYSIGLVKGSGENVGGLIGLAESVVAITESYWDTETTGLTMSAGGKGMTTDEMKKADTYSGWDFDAVWKIDEGNDYPELR